LRGFIVIDLGFGDSGKGLLTDFLTRRTGAGLVVRYNGGAQAGHNVVTPDGTHHTFSQFGSGTFVPGVRTFLSRHVVLHPTALLVEREALESKGIRDAFERLRISEGARVITPYHQAANRVREIAQSDLEKPFWMGWIFRKTPSMPAIYRGPIRFVPNCNASGNANAKRLRSWPGGAGMSRCFKRSWVYSRIRTFRRPGSHLYPGLPKPV
jgi:hypothetical protein